MVGKWSKNGRFSVANFGDQSLVACSLLSLSHELKISSTNLRLMIDQNIGSPLWSNQKTQIFQEMFS